MAGLFVLSALALCLGTGANAARGKTKEVSYDDSYPRTF